MNTRVLRMWKEVVAAYFKVQFQFLRGRTQESCETRMSEKLIFGSRFKIVVLEDAEITTTYTATFRYVVVARSETTGLFVLVLVVFNLIPICMVLICSSRD
jgi:hypothetical protein